ncbi:hypothetical protein D039_3510B, partial [Vibrio parahaemolyticus EKP-028]|jgi:hypothetical protein
VDT